MPLGSELTIKVNAISDTAAQELIDKSNTLFEKNPRVSVYYLGVDSENSYEINLFKNASEMLHSNMSPISALPTLYKGLQAKNRLSFDKNGHIMITRSTTPSRMQIRHKASHQVDIDSLLTLALDKFITHLSNNKTLQRALPHQQIEHLIQALLALQSKTIQSINDFISLFKALDSYEDFSSSELNQIFTQLFSYFKEANPSLQTDIDTCLDLISQSKGASAPHISTQKTSHLPQTSKGVEKNPTSSKISRDNPDRKIDVALLSAKELENFCYSVPRIQKLTPVYDAHKDSTIKNTYTILKNFPKKPEDFRDFNYQIRNLFDAPTEYQELFSDKDKCFEYVRSTLECYHQVLSGSPHDMTATLTNKVLIDILMLSKHIKFHSPNLNKCVKEMASIISLIPSRRVQYLIAQKAPDLFQYYKYSDTFQQ